MRPDSFQSKVQRLENPNDFWLELSLTFRNREVNLSSKTWKNFQEWLSFLQEEGLLI